MKWQVWVPLSVFLLLVILFSLGLMKGETSLDSPLMGEQAPAFSMPLLGQPGQTISLSSLQDKVLIVNFWASWCSGCREEHSILMDLSKDKRINLVGIAYQDQEAEAIAFLRDWSNPFHYSLFPENSRTAIDFGVYGVPETYVIDQQGVIRYKHTGPLTPQDHKAVILPLIDSLSLEKD